jgi:hypothetical protein
VGNRKGKLLFGMELELAFSVLDDEGGQLDSNSALELYLRVCSKQFLHLPGAENSQMFLANGNLVYPDLGHPELATAESPSPVTLLQSLRAGETMMADAAKELETQSGISNVNLYRTNVDYSRIGTTWGCHESYLSRRRPADIAPFVVDHLVSRVIYSGSGGFSNKSYSAAFVLSPRVSHLNAKIGNDGGGRRAIFSLRNEPLSKGGYHRVHMICGEANCSELSTYLKVGTTALVIAMADANVDFGMREKSLKSPLSAMNLFSQGLDCTRQALCNDGITRSAIDIQRGYLALAERNLGTSFMPEWAEEVCNRWRKVLDDLESDRDALIGSLDWPTKLAIFKQHVRTQSSLSWNSLPVWNSVSTKLANALMPDVEECSRVTNRQVKAVLGTKGAIARRLKDLSRTLNKQGLAWEELDTFNDLRDQLCELDLRYGQLYPQGIHLSLEKAGQIRDQILRPNQIEAAIGRAPTAGRARVRGDWIRHFASRNEEYFCNWTHIFGKSGNIDLGDPFVTQADLQITERVPTSDHLPREPDSDVPAFMTEHPQFRLFD